MVEQRKRQRIEENSSFYYDNPDYRLPHFRSSQSDFRESSESESNVEIKCNEEDHLKKAEEGEWRNSRFWGIRSFDSRGFGKHRVTLHAMEMYGTDQDKNLLRVLRDVMEKETSVQQNKVSEKEASEEASATTTDEYYYDGGNVSYGACEDDETDDHAYVLAVEDTSVPASEKHDEKCQLGDAESSDPISEKHDITDGEVSVAVSEQCDISDKPVEKNNEHEKTDINVVQNTEAFINIKPQNDGTAKLQDVVDMSGQYLVDASTNLVYNIDNIDISQFTQIYLIDAAPQIDAAPHGEHRETNYTLKAIVEDVNYIHVKEEDDKMKEIDDKCKEIVTEATDKEKMEENDVKEGEKQVEVIDEHQKDTVTEGTEKEKLEEHDVKESEEEVQFIDVKQKEIVEDGIEQENMEECDAKESEEEVQLIDVKQKEFIEDRTEQEKMEKHDVKERGNKEECDVKESEVQVQVIVRHDTNKRPLSDTTCDSSSSDGLKERKSDTDDKKKDEETSCRSDTMYNSADKHDIASCTSHSSKEQKTDVDVDNSSGAEGDSVRLSPDESRVKISNEKLTVVDKPPRLRSETRGQYMCQLALQFTQNQHKKVAESPSQNYGEDSILYVVFHTFVSDFNG